MTRGLPWLIGLAGLLLIVFALVTQPASAAAPARGPVDPLAVANTVWPGSPCTGNLHVTFHRDLGSEPDNSGLLSTVIAVATGIVVNADGSFDRVSCDIAVDPAYWAQADTEERCKVLSHEAGHLDGLHHTATGVMSPDHTGWFAPCATTRERVMHQLAGNAGVPDYDVQCSRWQGRVLPCTVWLASRVARYRASVSGSGFVIRRVHPAHARNRTS